jgi:hypothetical protein
LPGRLQARHPPGPDLLDGAQSEHSEGATDRIVGIK